MTGWQGLFLDPLIGRDDDLRKLLETLSRARLVTLTGPGGSGKTRLASAAVASLTDAGRAAWFVGCAAIEDATIIGAAIAASMDLDDKTGRDPLELVISALHGSEAVLVLDNLEQVAGAGEVATRLLDATSDVAVIATSRRPLNVRGEVEFAVPPLALPADSSATLVAESPAGALFLTRAGAMMPSTTLDDATAADIARLVQRLDGLPLAIELAAARTRAMTPSEINHRLDQHGPESIDSSGGDRHGSLRSIIDWTIGQLSDEEAETLQAVSVCAGFDLPLAEALLPEVDILPAIESLISLGLVHRTDSVNGVTRFRLLQTIESAVTQRLSPETRNRFRGLHARRFLEVAAAWQAVPKSRLTELATSLDADADNIRRALDYLETADPLTELLLLADLVRFWASHGRAREGYERFRRAMTSSPQPSAELARAAMRQVGSIWLALPAAEYQELVALTMDLARAANDQVAIEDALVLQVIAAVWNDDTPRLLEAAAELESIATEDDLPSRLRLLEVRIHVAMAVHGRTSDEYVHQTRAFIAELQAAGREVAGRSVDLAFAHYVRGEFEESLRLSREAAETYRSLGSDAEAAWAGSYIGPALAGMGRVDEAVDAVLECASIAVRVEHVETVAAAIEAAIPVALAIGDAELAARLWGALVRGMVGRGEAPAMLADADPIKEWLRRAEAAAPKLAIELAVRDGEGSDPVELLKALPQLMRGPNARHASRGVLRHGVLTKREIEVLTLVGRGRSDPEIADALFISPKTASVHVSNIKGKLGVDSRLEVALKARELGLVEEPARA